ncbi:MAG: intramembrane zinc metalloprotease [Candidatus Westeberhardia cardiocondylae]|nr:intramembrane zinc metalloprotease [Candidatus Westeberhardia cardiocondylae]
MHLLFNFFTFVVTVSILITIHELGHFLTARYYNVMIEKFSIGFGKTLWEKCDKQGTKYIIACIPLGGYVKMLENNNKIQKLKNKTYFCEKKNWQKAIIIASGSICNIIFAIFIYWIIFFSGIINYRPVIGNVITNSIAQNIGLTPGMEIKSINNIATPNWDTVHDQLSNNINKNKTFLCISHVNYYDNNKKKTFNLYNYEANKFNNPITDLGIIPLHSKILPIVTKIENNSAGMKAGFQLQDHIISINGEIIKDWKTFDDIIQKSSNIPLNITVQRQEKQVNLILCPTNIIINKEKVGFSGISPKIVLLHKEYQKKYFFHPITSLIQSIQQTWNITKLIFKKLSEIFYGTTITLNSINGPLSIAYDAKIAAQYGLVHYLIFLAILSINLGIMNLLPIPILDGGYLIFLVIESYKKTPISPKTYKISYYISSIILIILMSIALVNDLIRFTKI